MQRCENCSKIHDDNENTVCCGNKHLRAITAFEYRNVRECVARALRYEITPQDAVYQLSVLLRLSDGLHK